MSSACNGSPVKVEAITDLTNAVGSTGGSAFIEGAQAAATAVNKSCELGHPVKLVVCNDNFSPNGAATCARTGVADHVVAATFISCCGDEIMPILAAAGIPTMSTGASSAENTSPESFPNVAGITGALGEVTLAVSTGAKNVAVVASAIPEIDSLVSLDTGQAEALGAKATIIRVPVGTTDFSSIAAQVLSSGATAVVPVLGSGPDVLLAKALIDQGANLQGKIKFVDDISNLTPKAIAQLGSQANGIYSTGFAWSPTDPTNPGIKRMLAELTAAGQPIGPKDQDLNTYTVMAWSAVHMMADALKGHPLTSKELIARLQTPGSVNSTQYGLPPFNFSKPAFTSGPLSKLRIFTRDTSVWRFNASGVPQSLHNGWVDTTQKMPLS